MQKLQTDTAIELTKLELTAQRDLNREVQDNQGAVNGGSGEGSEERAKGSELSWHSYRNTLNRRSRGCLVSSATQGEDELYVLKEEARALQRVEDFLTELVTTGELAQKTREGDNG